MSKNAANLGTEGLSKYLLSAFIDTTEQLKMQEQFL